LALRAIDRLLDSDRKPADQEDLRQLRSDILDRFEDRPEEGRPELSS
jgi:hypothetical protein